MDYNLTDKEIEILRTAYQALDDKFAIDIVVLDIRGISTMADFFIIASGGNPNSINAIVGAAEEKLRDIGLMMRHVEGLQTANWVLMDYGDIILHIFDKENRSFYHLERVWGDARVISPESIK